MTLGSDFIYYDGVLRILVYFGVVMSSSCDNVDIRFGKLSLIVGTPPDLDGENYACIGFGRFYVIS